MPREANHVSEISTSTGTGSMVLAGAVGGYRTWGAAFGVSDTSVYYGIRHSSNGTWEDGYGTFLAGSNAIQRDLVLASSSGGSKVAFASGDKIVYCQHPAEVPLMVRLSQSADIGIDVIPAASQSGHMIRVRNAAGGDAFKVSPTGKITSAGGLALGSTVAPGGQSDLSRHVDIYGSTYGFGVTAGALNAVSGGTFDFIPGGLGTVFARIDGSGRILGRETDGLSSMHGWIGMESSGMYRWTGTSIAFAVGGTQTMWMTNNNVTVPSTATFQALGGARDGNIRVGIDAGPSGTGNLISMQGNTGWLYLRGGTDEGVGIVNTSGTTLARFDPAGTAVPAAVTVITREKGDARYQFASSAAELKEDIDDLGEIDTTGIMPRTWTWRMDGHPRNGLRGAGFIYEEVEAAFPEATYPAGPGRPGGIDTNALLAAFVAATREALAAQGAAIAALGDRITALEAA